MAIRPPAPRLLRPDPAPGTHPPVPLPAPGPRPRPVTHPRPVTQPRPDPHPHQHPRPSPGSRPPSGRRPAHPAALPLSPSVYWRRRVVALLIGLSLLALVVWIVAGALGGGSPGGSPAATKPVSGAPASGSAASAAQGGAPAAGQQPGGHASATGHYALEPCPAGDVVLSVFSSQASYSLRQTPAFEVDVVSTGGRSCSFDIGARHVLLEISAGKQQIWTSAQCAEGQASLVTKLRRGVPTVVPIAWNGQHSSPGCPVPGAPAAAGTYTATASDGALSSNSVTFTIG